MPDLKICTRCKKSKNKTDFSIEKKRKSGLHPVCKECVNTYQRAHRKTEKYRIWAHKFKRTKKYKEKSKIYWNKNKDKIKDRRLVQMFGISNKDYLEMFKNQKGKCAICNKKPSGQKRFHIDHCHITNKVRGLLCVKCNAGLGMFCVDSKKTALLLGAIKYMKEFE